MIIRHRSSDGIGHLLLVWASAAVLLIPVFYVIDAIFTPENFHAFYYDPAVRRNVPVPGSMATCGQEGYGVTRYGAHGIGQIPDIATVSQPVAFVWGDSFIEGRDLLEKDKICQQADNFLGQNHSGILTASVARHYWSMADYCFLIPRYEPLARKPFAHVIHLFTLVDSFPDTQETGRVSQFTARDGFKLTYYDQEGCVIQDPLSSGTLTQLGQRYQATLFFHLIKKWKSTLISVRQSVQTPSQFLQRPQTSGNANLMSRLAPGSGNNGDDELICADMPPPREAWDYLLSVLRSTTHLPILIVYSPVIPRVINNSIELKNPEATQVAAFAEACHRNGIDFVSMEGAFLEQYHASGEFPRGHPTGRLTTGHYNSKGAALVGSTIATWLNSLDHAVHSN